MHKYIKIHMCVCGCIYTPTTAHSNHGNFPIGKNNNPLNIFQITVARRWVGPHSHFPPQGPDFVPCWSSRWKMHLVVSAGSQAAVCASHNAITQSDLCVGWRQVRRETATWGHITPTLSLPLNRPLAGEVLFWCYFHPQHGTKQDSSTSHHLHHQTQQGPPNSQRRPHPELSFMK